MSDSGAHDASQLAFRDVCLIEKEHRDNPLWDFFVHQEHRVLNKWLSYFKVYDEWLRRYRGADLTFVEIGVWKGGSMQMWSDYFGPKARIVGIDNNVQCKQFEGGQVTIEIGNQADPDFWAAFRRKYPQVDVLLDDGGHEMSQQIITFECMFPHIRDGGLYMAEDLHTSYMDGYKGGVRREGTFIEYAKRLIDDLHAFYGGGV